MAGDEPELWKAKMQGNRGVTVPAEVAAIWGLKKGERAILYFTLNEQNRVLVIPGKGLKSFFQEEV